MRRPWLVLAGCLACGRVVASCRDGQAAAPPVEDCYEIVLERPTPPVATDVVDVAVRADLGEEARWWGFAGSFKLHEAGASKVVALYYSDSNQNEWGLLSYPNFFALHAAVRDGKGKWVADEVYSCTRCGFGRVLRRGRSSVAAALQPWWRVHIDPRDTPEEQEQWRRGGEKANTPFTVVLSIRDGRFLASVSERR